MFVLPNHECKRNVVKDWALSVLSSCISEHSSLIKK